MAKNNRNAFDSHRLNNRALAHSAPQTFNIDDILLGISLCILLSSYRIITSYY